MMPSPRSVSSNSSSPVATAAAPFTSSSYSSRSSSSSASFSSGRSSKGAGAGAREQFDEAFLPRIVSVFFAIFHPTEGPKVLYQIPEGTIGVEGEEGIDEGAGSDNLDEDEEEDDRRGLFDFKNLSEYIIPKAPLCGRLVTCNAAGHKRRSSNGPRQTFKVLGHPVVLVDEAKYPRNNFIFNLAFVFDGRADVRAYEAIVRKCARQLKELELTQSFLSAPNSQTRMYGIIEQMYEDLNSYCETFIALPEAPHTRYLAVAKGDEEEEGEEEETSQDQIDQSKLLVGSLASAPMLAPGKREPPHGLGRTVREAINLKLFSVYANPPRVHDWEVPVALLNIAGRVDDNWDLTMSRILPFVNGVHHVKRIAQLADADLELTRQCIEHLLYYGCVMTLDTFQFSNMYAVRPQIAQLADGESIIAECAAYVIRPGYPLPSWPELLRLYAALRPGVTLAEWIEDEEVDKLGIDVRRFVTFATIKGFLRRVHRYPILMPGPVSTSRRGGQSQSRSREREPAGGRSSSATRARQESESGGAGRSHARESSPLRVSHKPSFSSALGEEGVVDASAAGMTGPFGGGPANGASQDRSRSRRRGRQVSSNSTATAMDVANVAFVEPQNPRSQHRRSVTSGSSFMRMGRGASGGGEPPMSSSTGGGLAGPASSSAAGTAAAAAAAASATSTPQPRAIPPDLAALLDGTRCDDELCARFSMPWVDMQHLLMQLGHSGRGDSASHEEEDGGIDDEAAAMASHFHQSSGYASAFQGFSAFSSVAGLAGAAAAAAANTPKKPGSRSTGNVNQRDSNTTAAAANNARSSAFSRATTGADSGSGWIRSGGGVTFGSGGGTTGGAGTGGATGAGAGGAAGATGGTGGGAGESVMNDAATMHMERESMLRGDYGRVKILLK